MKVEPMLLAKNTDDMTAISAMEAIIGPAQLLKGEKIDAYYALLGKVRDAVQPFDIIEEIAVHEIVRLMWENLRYSRWKVKLTEGCSHQGMRRVMALLVPDTRDRCNARELLSPSPADKLVDQWASGNPTAQARVGELLAKAKVDDDSIMAQTLAAMLDVFERIDRLMMQNEARNIALREIDRRRSAFARQMRQVIEDVSDVEYEDDDHAMADV